MYFSQPYNASCGHVTLVSSHVTLVSSHMTLEPSHMTLLPSHMISIALPTPPDSNDLHIGTLADGKVTAYINGWSAVLFVWLYP